MKSKFADTQSATDPKRRESKLLAMRTIGKLTIVACFILAPLLYAIEITSGGHKSPQTTEGKVTMSLTQTNPAPNEEMLTVPATESARIESATFALG